ncbi:MAG: hypothetical protein KBS52_06560 [Clostridiales bacterium]|nr:hypothetical protein [Candidatus Equinaster intestinalis]
MKFKRLTLFCGHYGSGKTNVAVNVASFLRKTHDNVALADLDIVNPYFRAKDSSDLLEKEGIRLICSEFANSNVDFPALPQEIYALTDDKSITAVLDIGGDERGALALGRLSPAINAENNFEMLMVVNKYRPLTPDTESVLEIKSEIENACKVKFTGIVNNSNLGAETTAQTVLDSVKYAEDIGATTGLPIVMTTVNETLFSDLSGKIPNLFPLKIKNLLEERS